MSHLETSYFTYAFFERITNKPDARSDPEKELQVMLIDTRAMGFPLTDAILGHVESRVAAALGPFARWILKVTVRLEDVNADRGGVDKRCSIVVALRRHGVEIAEATNDDLYAAVDEAVSRIRRSVIRRAKLHLARDRRDPNGQARW